MSGNLLCNGCNNEHLVKVGEQLWSWLEETKVDCHLQTGNKQQTHMTKFLFGCFLLTHPSTLTFSLCQLCGSVISLDFLLGF